MVSPCGSIKAQRAEISKWGLRASAASRTLLSRVIDRVGDHSTLTRSQYADVASSQPPKHLTPSMPRTTSPPTSREHIIWPSKSRVQRPSPQTISPSRSRKALPKRSVAQNTFPDLSLAQGPAPQIVSPEVSRRHSACVFAIEQTVNTTLAIKTLNFIAPPKPSLNFAILCHELIPEPTS
jgi:hypothetical protein